MALNTHRQLSINNTNTQKSLEKLSSGYRINRAGDDAAGLAISEKMRAQIRGLNMASKNAQDGISLIQTAEGGLNEAHSILQRMRELATQSANDTNVEVDRNEIQKEVDQLAKEITRIANNTEFNTQKLLNGGITGTKFHIGANSNQDIGLSISAMDAKSLGVSRDIIMQATGAVTSNTINSVSFTGTELGAGIVNNAVVDIDFTPAVIAETGTASIITAENEYNLTGIADLSGKDATITITVGTDAFTLAASDFENASSIDDVISVLGGATAGGTTTLSEIATITDDGGKLTIQLKDIGATELTFNVSGTDADAVLAVLGFTNDQTGTGTDSVAAESAKITLSSSFGHKQTIAISDPAQTTLSITDGNFKGMSITMKSGSTLADIGADDQVTITAQSAVASAAIFENGVLVTEATTEAGIDVSSQVTASKSITTIQKAIETVSAERSKLGALQNRLEHTINNLDASAENLSAAESRIRDVDMAKEMMEFTKQNILTQAATAMLAQANMAPQTVLKLLG